MPRLQKKPILYQDKLNIPKKYLRFATPKEVAVYRAERLKCDRLVEIGTGIGGQTLAFSKNCKKVLAIEVNKNHAKILIQNLKKKGINNVNVIIADALSKKAVEEIKKFQPDIIFCDTERPEKGERTIESIKPSIKEIIEIFSKTCSRISIEIPPFTKTEEIKGVFEKEFISLDNQLNRLTLYFNELKKADVSVISLPSKENLKNEIPKPKIKNVFSAKNYDYLYVINPSIQIANLLPEISKKFNSPILNLNKPVLVSNNIFKTEFLIAYKILSICKNEEKEIKDRLIELKTGKVILRYNINPKDYWKIRNFYENDLNGKREISLFVNELENEAILCEKFD